MNEEEKLISLDYYTLSESLVKKIIAALAAGHGDLVHQQKIIALRHLDIEVEEGQTPLAAWVLAMCRANGLPEVLPAIEIGSVAQEVCPKWVWFLA